jgi:hypothetical protein
MYHGRLVCLFLSLLYQLLERGAVSQYRTRESKHARWSLRR